MIERPITTIIEGVVKADPKAVETLWHLLNNNKAHLLIRRRGLTQEAEDIIITAFEAFCKIIRDGKFKPRAASEEWQQNQTRRYFEMVLNSTIKHFKMPHHPEINEGHAVAEVPEVRIRELSLLSKTIELINETGALCQRVLNYALVHGKSNKMIAKLNLKPALQKTEAVTQKKKECLNKLYANLVHHISSLPEKLQVKYIEVAMEAQQLQSEPCRSILKFHFSGKSNTEIAEELQHSLPAEMSRDYHTADQVKKKKSRCLNALREEIFKRIFNNRK